MAGTYENALRVSSFNSKQGPRPQPWTMTLTGLYGTLLKVDPLIPGNKRGSITEISHRIVDMVSARAERVIIIATRSRISLSSVIERRPRIQRILYVIQQAGEPPVPLNSTSRKAFGGGRFIIEATIPLEPTIIQLLQAL